MHGRRIPLIGFALLLGLGAPAAGQGPLQVDRFPAAPPAAWEVGTAGKAFLLSAIVPGAGQYALGLERWAPYVAIEGWAWLRYADRRGDGHELAGRYRDLAWSVARRVSAGDARVDPGFPYYEAVAKTGASGEFDIDRKQDGIQPESDTLTHNGKVWQLAQGLHMRGRPNAPVESAEYQRALGYYSEHAIPPELAWAWGDNGLEQQAYTDLIRSSDEAFRDATQVLGLVLANHLVSAIDALVAARLAIASGGRSPLRIRSGLELDGRALRWNATVHLLGRPW